MASCLHRVFLYILAQPCTNRRIIQADNPIRETETCIFSSSLPLSVRMFMVLFPDCPKEKRHILSTISDISLQQCLYTEG